MTAIELCQKVINQNKHQTFKENETDEGFTYTLVESVGNDAWMLDADSAIAVIKMFKRLSPARKVTMQKRSIFSVIDLAWRLVK